MSTNVTEHQRPGVYSVYEASSAAQPAAGSGAVGLIVETAIGDKNSLYTMRSRKAAENYFGDDIMTELVGLLLDNGAAVVHAVPVSGVNNYPVAMKILEKKDDIRVMVCSETSAESQKALIKGVNEAAAARKERLAVIGGADGESVADLVSRSKTVNSERTVLVGPGGVQAAAALAGVIASQSDPALPLGGVTLKGITKLDAALTDDEIDTLVNGGVTPLEMVGGEARVIRAVSTRTTTDGVKDSTWKEVNTIRVVDHMMAYLRDALAVKFSRVKNTEQTRGAIRSQVIVELERKKDEEIIAGYDNVRVSAVEGNPTVCLVEFDFTVAHGLNQIWLSANITV